VTWREVVTPDQLGGLGDVGEEFVEFLVGLEDAVAGEVVG
jgi:hypothetical protein